MKLSALPIIKSHGPAGNIIHKGITLIPGNLFAVKGRSEAYQSPVMEEPDDSLFYKKQVELAGTGKRVKATVLYVAETGLLINEDPVISLTIRFHNLKKAIQEITAKTVVSRIAIPKAADIITIAYNAKDLSMIAVL